MVIREEGVGTWSSGGGGGHMVIRGRAHGH